MVLQPGTRLRDYEIMSLIGRGGMGEVYKAKELTLDREVAIKVLTSRGLDDPLFLQRFVNEAKIHARLSHSNIVDIYTFFEEAKVHYIAMQYAPGITLTELIRTTGLIPEPRALAIFRQICEALAYAHARGVVHRDVKPSNVMVDPQDGDRVKVMDFGIARLLGAQHITRTGTQMGTVCYMSPEQVLGEKEIDHRSDIYSAGVLLYEMLTGILPYNLDTESLFKIQNRILQEPLPDPREAYPHISDGTVALLKSFTQKEREDRPVNVLKAWNVAFRSGKAPVVIPVANPDKSVLKDVKNSPMSNNPDRRDSSHIEKTPAGKKTRSWPWLVFLPIVAIVALVIIQQIQEMEMTYRDGNKQKQLKTQSQVVKPQMILVEGGSFMMGSNALTDEKPVHEVQLSSFYISRYETTQKEWKDIMGNNLSYFENNDYPVEQVTWYDVLEYCNKRSYKEGFLPCYKIDKNKRDTRNYNERDIIKWSVSVNWKANGYRLPTEAEWEYAARGGKKSNGYKFSGSSDIGPVAWYERTSDDTGTTEVGSKSANELGLHDMSGNVWEWCWDWYGSNSYVRGQSSNPKGPEYGSTRVLRGGSWDSISSYCRTTCRCSYGPDGSFNNYGFRVVRAIF